MVQNLVRTKLPALDPARAGGGGKVDLRVIFTDLPRTAAALQTARAMANGLGARITVLVAQVVPYPLPLAAPPVPVEFTKKVMESVPAMKIPPSKFFSAAIDTNLSTTPCRRIPS